MERDYTQKRPIAPLDQKHTEESEKTVSLKIDTTFSLYAKQMQQL